MRFYLRSLKVNAHSLQEALISMPFVDFVTLSDVILTRTIKTPRRYFERIALTVAEMFACHQRQQVVIFIAVGKAIIG